MTSLDDAWKWYLSVKELTLTLRDIGKKHWNALPWEGPLGNDDRLRHIAAPQILDWAGTALADLDDLCVLLLFSVFEAIVRKRALDEVAAELPTLKHPAILHAVAALNEALEHGSFFKVTEAYKHLDADLVEQVNQVRRYRNWVAHGRRERPQDAVDPRTAFERLQRFLDRLDKKSSPEL